MTDGEKLIPESVISEHLKALENDIMTMYKYNNINEMCASILQCTLHIIKNAINEFDITDYHNVLYTEELRQLEQNYDLQLQALQSDYNERRKALAEQYNRQIAEDIQPSNES